MNGSLFLDVFRDVVARRAQNAAIECAGEVVFSYRELDWRARSLASLLIEYGAAPEQFVGIKISKSPDYIVAMLAVWYAGAAFVPLDPMLPAARLDQIEADCKPVFVVEPQHLNVESTPVAQPVAIDLDALAYAMFTSGSTGRPKGVLVTHSGVVNLLEEQIKAFAVTDQSRSLFMLSTNFDASVSDIGCALLSGATLCMEPEASLKPGPEFAMMVGERRITHIDIPPSVLRMLSCSQMPACLETLIVGGEVCPIAVVREWARRFRLVNVYGPTEATVCTSLGQCDPDTWNRPLIGTPLRNVEYKILDNELLIGGICLARGYLNRPELTERKFITFEGKRWYRTGDRVLLHEDGEYEFQGRIDRQVKVRGVLVEPEEIEACLAEHPAVQRVVVLKRRTGSSSAPLPQGLRNASSAPSDGRGDAFASPSDAANQRDGLVAFLQVPGGEPLPIKELRAFVAEKLPRWMIPQRWQFVESFPMTVTGKPDFDALRSCPLLSRHGGPEFTLERGGPVRPDRGDISATAVAIISVIESVFAIEGVQLEDNVFDLGADSLNIIEISLAADVRGVSLSPALLMAKPLIADLVAAVHCRESGVTDATASGGIPASVLRKDVALNDEWRSMVQSASERPGDLPKVPANVLVTGASGFLGSRMLHQLLLQAELRVFCFVRCVDATEGLSRIQQAMRSQGLRFDSSWTARLEVIPADLSVSLFGLTGDNFTALAERIDTVYHCAAQVNVVLPYSEMRAANVGGTFEVVRFCLTGRRKWLHYASTLSVFVATDQNEGTVLECDNLQHTKVVYGGYAQTKWASEVLLHNVRLGDGAVASPFETQNSEPKRSQDGISIYRFGLIVGDSRTGHAPKNDFLAMFAKGISSIGAVPDGQENLAVDITPIDFAAAAMLQLSLHDMAGSGAHTYHIANPAPLKFPDLIAALRQLQVRIDCVPLPEFQLRIKRASNSGRIGAAEAAACLALCRSDAASFENYRTMDLFQATNIKFDMRNTLSRLLGLSCPPADSRLMAVLAKHFLAQASV